MYYAYFFFFYYPSSNEHFKCGKIQVEFAFKMWKMENAQQHGNQVKYKYVTTILKYNTRVRTLGYTHTHYCSQVNTSCKWREISIFRNSTHNFR